MRRASGLVARRSRGRTLLELLVSITIGAVLLGVIISIYSATTPVNRQAAAVTRMSEDAAVAMSFIGNQLRMAGFSPPRVSVSPGSTVVKDGATVSFPDRNFIGAAVRGCDAGFVDATVPFEDLACATTAGTDSLAVRFEGDTDSTPAITVAGVSYPSDCLNQAVTLTSASAYDAAPYALVESRFSVLFNAATDSPEFHCAGNGNAFAPLPMFQYVDDMAIQYGLAADAQSAQVVRYASAAQVDALGGTVNDRWSRVVSVRICLEFRSAEPVLVGDSSHTNCLDQAVATSDGYLRRAYATVFALRNRTGP